jgi:hypothetical protein
MSESTLQAIIPALIALVGTLLTILIGVWQWRKQTTAGRTDQFQSDKQAAYKSLWDNLETAHITLRVDNHNPADYQKLVQTVNSFILKHALYLEDQDRLLANTYLKQLQAFAQYVQSSQDTGLKETWADTGAFPPEMTAAIRAYRDMDETRQQILERCRKMLSGEGI